MSFYTSLPELTELTVTAASFQALDVVSLIELIFTSQGRLQGAQLHVCLQSICS